MVLLVPAPAHTLQNGGHALFALQCMDEKVLLWIQEHRRPVALNYAMKFFTCLGNGGFIWIIISIAMLFKKPTYHAGMCAGLALTFGVLFTNLGLKPFVARPRPYVTLKAVTPLLISQDPNSFPSGHTCAAFSAGIAWAATLPGRWMPGAAIVQAVCMGYSRLYVGVHYPSDVIAGAIVGSLCAALSLAIL